uniref:Uncharacterized protein n=1 Tax=Maylandia zebra TaxID=106582 RepID=A0A3P9DFX2_9CICH
CVIVTAVCTAAGAIGAVVTAPALLGAAGFNSAGIAAGSCAAGMMSSAAASNGGEVTAGGVVAVLQSAGKYIIRCFIRILTYNNMQKEEVHGFGPWIPGRSCVLSL